LVGDDFVGHDVVEYCADCGACHLHSERYPGSKMAVLCELEVLGEELALDEGVISLDAISMRSIRSGDNDLRRARSTYWRLGCPVGCI
jgi:hypothetical protein